MCGGSSARGERANEQLLCVDDVSAHVVIS